MLLLVLSLKDDKDQTKYLQAEAREDVVRHMKEFLENEGIDMQGLT